MFSTIAALVGFLSVLVPLILAAGQVLIICVCWLLIKDIVNTVGQWLHKIGAHKAVAATYSFFRSLLTDASKSATPEKKVEYEQVKEILNRDGADLIVLAQNPDGDIIQIGGIKGKTPSITNVDEDPENYILNVIKSGKVEKIKITD